MTLLSLAGHRLKARRSVELILERLPFHNDDAAAAAGMTPDELAHSVMTAISDHLNWQSTSTVDWYAFAVPHNATDDQLHAIQVRIAR